MSPEQRQEIFDIYKLLGYTAEQLPERVSALEDRMQKKLANFTEWEARDTIKKMRESLEKKQAQAPATREVAEWVFEQLPPEKTEA